jgi:translation initiation factor eIF-6, putative
MMRLSRYDGSPNIGVYAVVNESLAIVAPNTSQEFLTDLEIVLGVQTFMTTVSSSFLVGSLVAMNSNGAVVSSTIEASELEEIRKHIPIEVLPTDVNAAGNNILINDKGAIVNPDLNRKSMKLIEDFLGVEVIKSTISGCNIVGSVCSVTNKGCLCNVNTSDEEIKLIQDIFKVEAKKTSVNHGSKYIGPGVLCNSKGALIGDDTTPIEMGKIEDGLVLY